MPLTNRLQCSLNVGISFHDRAVTELTTPRPTPTPTRGHSDSISDSWGAALPPPSTLGKGGVAGVWGGGPPPKNLKFKLNAPAWGWGWAGW